jgi:hypothetical protein
LTTGSRRDLTAIAAQPLLHLGGGLPEAKARAGYEFAVVVFEVDAAGKGTAGDFAPAAKLTVRSDDSFVVEDYGAEVVRLTQIRKK